MNGARMWCALRRAVAIIVLSRVALDAQAPDSVGPNSLDPVTRSEVARAAFRRAGASNRAGLPDSAYADVRRAHEAWPTQPAYAEGLARLAARRGDAETVVRVLARLTAQEIGAGAAIYTSIASLAARDARVASARTALLSTIAGSAGAESIV